MGYGEAGSFTQKWAGICSSSCAPLSVTGIFFDEMRFNSRQMSALILASAHAPSEFPANRNGRRSP